MKTYSKVDDQTVAVKEDITTNHKLEDVKADIQNRISQIASFNQQKADLDTQIQVQQDMIDKDNELLAGIEPLLPAPVEVVESVIL